MNKAFQYILITAILTMVGGLTAQAQSGYPDLNLGLGYEPQEIVEEWNAWFEEPTQENAFIGEFLEEYEVPQSGQNGLSRKEVWYWWASHNPEEIAVYIDRRNEAVSQ